MEEQVAEFRDLYPTLPLNANHFEMWQRNSRTIEAMTAFSEKSVPLGVGEHPVQVETALRHARPLPGFERAAATGSCLYRTKTRSPAASALLFS